MKTTDPMRQRNIDDPRAHERFLAFVAEISAIDIAAALARNPEPTQRVVAGLRRQCPVCQELIGAKHCKMRRP